MPRLPRRAGKLRASVWPALSIALVHSCRSALLALTVTRMGGDGFAGSVDARGLPCGGIGQVPGSDQLHEFGNCPRSIARFRIASSFTLQSDLKSPRLNSVH